MIDPGASIRTALQAVAQERLARQHDATLSAAVQAVKQYQHARFASTYADLLREPRYAGAARFFLSDLYGPGDFSDRDAQFERIVPALVRLFPADIVATVGDLAALHALSESLDSRMGQALLSAQPAPAVATPPQRLQGATYGAAWRRVGNAPARQEQIDWMLAVGRALDRFTRSLVLRQSLKLMRGPAQMAGLGALQGFLERGFDTFRGMKGADFFLHTVAERERALAAALFAGADGPTL
jgi:hypothetical protein